MRYNIDLTTGSIPRHIAKLAIPASLGLFFNTMFNVVDTFYAGKISTTALAALSISFPVFFILLALGRGIGTGTTALVAVKLGEKNPEGAGTMASQAISFAILFSFLLTVVGYLIMPALFRILGAEGAYLDLALEYMNVIILGTLFFVVNGTLNGILMASGDTRSFSHYLLLGFLLNLIFDPWFMYGGLGVPALGLKGIALATVIIQCIGTVYLIFRLKRSGIITQTKLKQFKPKTGYFKDIAEQGFPASLSMLTVAIGIFVITFFISKFSKEAVAAYGIAARIEQIVLLPTIGLNIASLSLTGQNYGARNFARIKEAFKLNLLYGVIIMIIGMVCIYLLAPQLMRFFTGDEKVIAVGAKYLSIAAFVFVSYIFIFISVSVLQGMKRPYFALWVGIVRQIALPVIIFPFFSYVLNMGLNGIWWGVFTVNWAAAIFSLWFTIGKMKKVEKKYNSVNTNISASANQ